MVAEPILKPLREMSPTFRAQRSGCPMHEPRAAEEFPIHPTEQAA